MLAADKLKVIQFAEDGGLIASKIIGLEGKTNVEFEHEHTKTTNGNEDTIIKKGLTVVLEFDKKSKEEMISFMREDRGDYGLAAGNTSLKYEKEIIEKSVSKVTKGKDNDSNFEEHVQHKNG